MLKKVLLSLVVCTALSGCNSAESDNVPVKSVEGKIISNDVCQVGRKCEAVIARDGEAWTYQLVEGPFKKGDKVFKACAYYPNRERCSTVWSSIPDQFIPPESKK